MESNVNFNPKQGVGLNTDSASSQLKQGEITFALNALISSFDGQEIVIQNEEGNIKCTTFPEGYKVIGVFNITQINRVVYLLTNPTTKQHEIGYTDNNDCTYNRLVWGECLNFDVSRPVLQIVVKSTNCGYSMYWTDGTLMRHIDFEDLPWREVTDPDNDFRKIKVEGELDCNKLLVQPKFSIPKVDIDNVTEGGSIKEGSYQFVVQYANELGESYTAFYNPTNPISIKEGDRASQNFDLTTNKAINVKVSGLDNSGIFDYFNLVVIETINGISTNKLIGTYPIADTDYTITYDGLTGENIQISSIELFQRYQHYDMADGVTTSDDRLIWYGLKKRQRNNYQQIWSQVRLYWQTFQIPYTDSEAYNNPMNTLDYKGYMRDEVYPIEGCFILDNGEQTDSCVLVGRRAKPTDLEVITNFDASNHKNNECEPAEDNKKRWEVYNTALVLGTDESYDPNDSCYKGPYQYGEFSYWESEERYPNNKDIWGSLAGQKIRHFKFPDETVSPRFSTKGDKEFIYPIGIKLDIDSLRGAINDSDIPDEDKRRIVGFKIFRGDRSSGNMSIKAKGHFTNVGKYDYDGQEYYFANYPYNDLGEDPLFAIKDIEDHSGYKPGLSLKPFEGNQGKDQFVFHSPDTHFGRVGNINSGYLKLESIDYGEGRGNFVKVKNNAEYKFTTRQVIMTAAVLATGVGFDVSRNGTIEFNGSDFSQTFNNIQELLEKLVPYQNMGFNINSVANFNKSFPVPNNGFKIRQISSGKYIHDGYHSIEDGKTINHFRRESSVYINTSGEFNYAHEYSPIIPEDNSRFIYTTARSLENTEMTDHEIFQELSKSNIRSATSVVWGIMAAADELANGSYNLKIILTDYLTHLFQPYLQTADYDGLLALKNASEDCGNLGEPRPIHPNSARNISSKQNIYVRDYDGQELLDWRIGQTINIPQLSFVATNDQDVVHNNIPYLKTNENIIFHYYDDEYQATLTDAAQITTTCPDPTASDYENCLTLRGIGFFSLQLMKVQTEICGGDILSALHKVFEYAKDAYFNIDEPSSTVDLSKIRGFNVNAYYGSLKQYLPAQWGRVYSYQTVDTGVYYDINQKQDPVIFGGDTFINKFSFKTKLPVFTTNLVGEPDQKDVALDEDGNLGYPMFYISTKPQNFEYNIDEADLATSFEGIGVTVRNKAIGSSLQSVGSAIMLAGGLAASTVVGSLAGAIIALAGAVVYIVGAIFSNVGNKVRKAMIRIYKDLLRQVVDNFGVKNINLDNGSQSSISESGMLYQYVYGNPVYFVESQVNVDYRQATNDNEGNFYPRVGTGIPNDWLQEDRVPIIHDNVYHYNKSYSKQNKETPYTHLPENFDASKECQFEFPNRAFWSEKSSLNETLNNWLIYKPVSRFDFPKSFGNLTSLDGILNRQVIARFTNKTQIYNALTTVNTTTFQAFLGNDQLFTSSPPLDLTETDTGSLGSQHKFLLKTPHGIVFTDVKRGQVILLQGTTPTIISNIKMQKWFKQYMASNTLADNHFNGEGITGVYDEFYDRIIITLLGEQSWTLSFSFKTNSWVSWHSYLPKFYVGHTDYFDTSNNDGSLWSHNKTNTLFSNFYGNNHKYIIEYPFSFKIKDEVIQGFRDYTTALRYEDYDTPVEEQNTVYFNKAIVYNTNQTTGVLNLIPKPKGLRAYKNVVQYKPDSKDILLTKTDHIYNFNNIVDIVKDRNKAIFESNSSPVKENLEFVTSNLEYGKRAFKSTLIRSKDARVRLILDDKNNYKLLSHIALLQTQESDL